MKKYFDNVISIFNRNPSAFILINHIAIGLMLLPYLLIVLINGSTFGIPMPNPYGMYSGSGASSEFGWVIFLLMIFSVFVQSYVMAGYYTYINSKDNGENPYSIFFNGAAAKFGRALGAGLLQILVVLIAAIVIGLVLGLILVPFMLDGPNLGASYFITFLVTAIAICVVIFFMFMLNEAVLTETPISGTVKASFNKVKKVFWPLFLLVIVQTSLIYLFQYLGMNFYLMIIISLYLTMLFNTFIDYPLYMHASDIAGSPVNSSTTIVEETKEW